VTIENVTGFSQPVTYPLPTVSAGTPPVSMTCTPAPGTTFNLGDTPVTCTASDASGRQATCGFTVSLRHKALAISRILAFGDSLTEGENGRPVNGVSFVDLPHAYPTILQQLFLERIPSQQISVVNGGKGGERITDSEDRLKSRVAAVQPQVLLLVQGLNDLIARVPNGEIVAAVRDSIQTARERGVTYVFVGTVPPQARENCVASIPCRADTVPQAALTDLNQRIRSIVPGNGAHLVEVHDQLLPNRLMYVDTDGMHLRPEGYRAIAEAFWNRIVEVIPSPQLTGLPAGVAR
jgi:lysophospholipase L1-like esterase